jgi:hypothetical protein
LISTVLVREFERVRQELCRAGVPVHVPWSLSIADGSTMVITPADAGAQPLAHADLVATSLHYGDGRAARASKDADLHRAAYARGRHRAVLICRPPYAMTVGSMQPQLVCGKRTVAAIDCAELAKHPRTFADELILLKGNALLSAGVDPASCLEAVLALEQGCMKQLGGGVSRPG